MTKRSALSINVNDKERTISAVLGALLLARGLRRGSLLRLLVGGGLLYRGLKGHSYIYEQLDINTAGGPTYGYARHKLGASAESPDVTRAVTIGKPANELYRFWRDPGNLTRIMGHFAEVSEAGEDRQHWKVQSPTGQSLEWDARIVNDQPGNSLSWESLPGAELPNQGSVHFHPAPGGRGTEVKLHLRFDPPGGAIGEAAMKRLSAAPSVLVDKALYRFKSLVETGEIPTLEHNPSARQNNNLK
jgi:uncharacterized membrane protein